MKRTTIAKDFEAKQANPGGVLDRTQGSDAPLGASLSGPTMGAASDWPVSVIDSDQFASKDELGELRQAVAMKVSYCCESLIIQWVAKVSTYSTYFP